MIGLLIIAVAVVLVVTLIRPLFVPLLVLLVGVWLVLHLAGPHQRFEHAHHAREIKT